MNLKLEIKFEFLKTMPRKSEHKFWLIRYMAEWNGTKILDLEKFFFNLQIKLCCALGIQKYIHRYKFFET